MGLRRKNNKKTSVAWQLKPGLVSVQSLSCVHLFATPWTAACQASLSITNSWSLLKLMSIESVMPSNHLILCRPLPLPPSIFPSIRVFSNESVLRIRWPEYWSFSVSISPSNEYSGLISSRMDKSSPWNPLVKKCWTLQGAFCYRIWDGNAFMVLKYKQLPWNGHELFLLNQGKVYKKW